MLCSMSPLRLFNSSDESLVLTKKDKIPRSTLFSNVKKSFTPSNLLTYSAILSEDCFLAAALPLITLFNPLKDLNNDDLSCPDNACSNKIFKLVISSPISLPNLLEKNNFNFLNLAPVSLNVFKFSEPT